MRSENLTRFELVSVSQSLFMETPTNWPSFLRRCDPSLIELSCAIDCTNKRVLRRLTCTVLTLWKSESAFGEIKEFIFRDFFLARVTRHAYLRNIERCPPGTHGASPDVIGSRNCRQFYPRSDARRRHRLPSESWILRSHPRRLAKLAHEGGGPVYRRWGSRAIYFPGELLQWAESRASDPRSSTSAHGVDGE